MSLPTSQPIPDEDDLANLPPARKRRGRRMLLPLGSDQRAAFLDELAHRCTPSFDYFLFSLLSGLVFGIGFLLNAPALLVLAALLAPFMGPVIGLSLATIIGSGRFFLLTLSGSITGAAMAFCSSALVGLIPRFFPGLPFVQPGGQAALTWQDGVLLGLGTIVTTLSMVRSENRPAVPSVAIAYVLYIPAAAAGFGLASGLPHLWPDGLIVFMVYLTGSILLGTLLLAVMGFRPLNLFGYTLGTTIALTSLLVMVGLSGIGTALQAQIALPPTPAPGQTQASIAGQPAGQKPVSAPALAASTTPTLPAATETPAPPTVTSTPTNTLIPSKTPTITATISPTPVWASVNALSQNGAVIRSEPSYTAKIITSVLNGTLIQVLPDIIQDGPTIWAHVRTNNGQEGWIVQSLLVTATPAPGW